VIGVGTCAISGGVFEASPALDRSFLGKFAPQLYVAGCPPHPLAIVNGILDLMGHADGRHKFSAGCYRRGLCRRMPTNQPSIRSSSNPISGRPRGGRKNFVFGDFTGL